MTLKYGLGVLSLISLFASCLMGQQIYTNGPISTGATSVTADGGGTAAPTGYTWSEMNTTNTVIGFSLSVASNFRIADDFTVAAGDVWTVSSVDVYAYQTGTTGATSPITGGTLRIWSGNPASGGTVVAGDTTTNVMTSSVQEFVYRITGTASGTTREVYRTRLTLGTAAALAAGTYWVDVQLTASGAGNCFTPPVTVTGTPSPAGANAQQFNGTAWAAAVDGAGAQALAFLVNGTISTATAPSITSTAVTSAAVGVTYNYQVTATGNPSTFTFSASGLPAWLSISGTGLISGTPAAGDIGTTGTITVTVANGVTPNATQNFSITVAASVAPAITSTAVTTATEGTAYTYTFTVTGNPTPTLSLTTGTLPAWLTFSGNTLSGTPPAGSAATYGPFTFTATNGVTPDATQTFSIVVSATSSGGGGGGDGGCSTGNGQSWLMLAGLLAALGVALRSRKARA